MHDHAELVDPPAQQAGEVHLHGSHGHAHDHGSASDHHHDDGHVHHHAPAVPRGQHVVLDIGGGVGALIVHTDPGLLGLEVEISPGGEDGRRSHKQVLERLTAAGKGPVLVYDELPAGSYTLWLDDRALARDVEVRDGEVAELDWRGRELVPIA